MTSRSAPLPVGQRVSSRAMTRSASRSLLRTRFLVTALPTLLLTTIPTLTWPCLRGIQRTPRYFAPALRPRRRRLKSRSLLSDVNGGAGEPGILGSGLVGHAQALAAFRAATLDDVTACGRGHAGTEAVRLGALAAVWLIGTLHGRLLSTLL